MDEPRPANRRDRTDRRGAAARFARRAAAAAARTQHAVSRAGALRWLLATGLFAASLAARFALVGTLPDRGFPFLTFFPATLLAAWLCGLRAGLLVATLSVAAAWYWFIGTPGSFGGTTVPDTIALGFFFAILLVDCVVIHVMNRSLSRAVEAERRLREADARKDEFIAMLAHELRNPLAPVVNAIWMLRRRETLSEPGRSALAMLERQALQMQRLVDELLDLGRIVQGKIAIAPEPVVLDVIVEQVVESLRPIARARGQSLVIEPAARPVAVIADPARITQVLENLLTNASKFSLAGAAIRVTLEETRDGARIRVADSGIGLSTDDLERIFGMFVQAPARGPARGAADHGASGAAGSRDGLGVGLALVRRLVELHGGRVWAHSDGPGRGATFTVELARTPPRNGA